jgi:cob(I)alamin adenosyltransferase
LIGGERVAKHSARIATYGTIDEVNAVIGLVRLHTLGTADEMLARIQNDLFDLGADLATPGESASDGQALRVSDHQVERLEREIDQLNDALPALTSFVLPGGTPAAANLHLARTITRRAERAISELAQTEPVNLVALRYTNRLSDHFFVLGRHLNEDGKRDVLWVPGANL